MQKDGNSDLDDGAQNLICVKQKKRNKDSASPGAAFNSEEVAINEDNIAGIEIEHINSTKNTPGVSNLREAVNLISQREPPSLKCVSASIKDYVIKKNMKRSNRPLHNIRSKIPEMTSTPYTVCFVLEVYAALEIHTVQRKYQEFKLLHNQLRRRFPHATMPLRLPIVKPRRYDNEYIGGRIQALNNYLRGLLQVTTIAKSEVFQSFLEEYPPSDDSSEGEDPLSPATLLQASPEITACIRNKSTYEVSIEVQNSESVVAWQFCTSKFDLGFCARFNGEAVRPYTREDCAIKPVKGTHFCPSPGIFTLIWDNSYSWRRSKRLHYRAEVLSLEGSEVTHNLGGSPRPACSEGTFEIEDNEQHNAVGSIYGSNPTAIIERVHSSSLGRVVYPLQARKIVGMIPKPRFRRRIQPPLATKSGFLLVLLGKKFGRRQWSRKWFELQVDTGILRYYSKERTVRTIRSYRTISLHKQKAYLEIVGSPDTAPTPFSLIIQAGKRRIELCAENALECEYWREAITASIFLAEWVNEQQNSKAEKDYYKQIYDSDIMNDEGIADEMAEDSDADAGYTSEEARNHLSSYGVVHELLCYALNLPDRRCSSLTKMCYLMALNILCVAFRYFESVVAASLLLSVNIAIIWMIYNYIHGMCKTERILP